MARYNFKFKVRQECSTLRVPDELKLAAGVGSSFELVNYGDEHWSGIKVLFSNPSVVFDVLLSEAQYDGVTKQIATVTPRVREGSHAKSIATTNALMTVWGSFGQEDESVRLFGTKEVRGIQISG